MKKKTEKDKKEEPMLLQRELDKKISDNISKAIQEMPGKHGRSPNPVELPAPNLTFKGKLPEHFRAEPGEVKLVTSENEVRCQRSHILPVEYWGEKCPYCREVEWLTANGRTSAEAKDIVARYIYREGGAS